MRTRIVKNIIAVLLCVVIIGTNLLPVGAVGNAEDSPEPLPILLPPEPVSFISILPELIITSDRTEVTIGVPTDVTFIVLENTCPPDVTCFVGPLPISGVRVISAYGSGITDADGKTTITINALAAGEIPVIAVKERHQIGITSINAIKP